MAKLRIDKSAALDLLRNGFGLKVREFNHYQLRIQHQEDDAFFDWYHTTGALVGNQNHRCWRVGTYRDPEAVAEVIQNHALQ